MEQLRFESCDRENRTITLNNFWWPKAQEFHFAKDLPLPKLDGIAPGDQVNVQFDAIEWQKGWVEKRIVTIEKYRPD